MVAQGHGLDVCSIDGFNKRILGSCSKEAPQFDMSLVTVSSQKLTHTPLPHHLNAKNKNMVESIGHPLLGGSFDI